MMTFNSYLLYNRIDCVYHTFTTSETPHLALFPANSHDIMCN